MQFEWFGQCAMAISQARLGHRAEAIEAMTRGMSLARLNAQLEGASFEDRLGPWMCRFQAARARRALEDMTEATQQLEEVARHLREVLATRPTTILPYVGLTDTQELLAETQPEQRCTHLGLAAAAWATWTGPSTPFVRQRQSRLQATLADCPRKPQ